MSIMSLSARLLAGCLLLGACALAQVPPTVAQIAGVDTSTGLPYLEVVNDGTKAIRVVIFSYAGTPGYRAEFSMPFGPTETGRCPLEKSDSPDKFAITEVIFADSSHMGAAIDPATSRDVREYIFEGWQGYADAVVAWQNALSKLPTDDHAFLVALKAKLDALPIKDVSYSHYASHANKIDQGMRNAISAVMNDISLGHPHPSLGDSDPFAGVRDEDTLHKAILNWVNNRAKQFKLMAIDGGEVSK